MPNRDEVGVCSDEYAPEHLTVQAADLNRSLDWLPCCGSLFATAS